MNIDDEEEGFGPVNPAPLNGAVLAVCTSKPYPIFLTSSCIFYMFSYYFFRFNNPSTTKSSLFGSGTPDLSTSKATRYVHLKQHTNFVSSSFLTSSSYLHASYYFFRFNQTTSRSHIKIDVLSVWGTSNALPSCPVAIYSVCPVR